jgi:glycosyltransferase involved in cell wall biosynthesis
VANIGRYKPLTNYWVTAVIPAYNEENWIKDCILSLRNQNIPIEVIVVDDGSKDRTFAICEALGVKTLSQSHKGPGAARNIGALNSKGNILVFVDADMEVAPNYVSKLVEPIIRGEAIATCHWNEMVANWENPWARCQTWFAGRSDKRREPIAIPDNAHVYRGVRKDFFLERGGFAEDEGRGDDTSIARRTGVYSTVVPDATCYHRNADNLKEVFREALWRGRNITVVPEDRFKRCFLSVLIHNNLLLGILRGVKLSIVKKEPRLVIYGVIHSIGLNLGTGHGLITGYYHK